MYPVHICSIFMIVEATLPIPTPKFIMHYPLRPFFCIRRHRSLDHIALHVYQNSTSHKFIMRIVSQVGSAWMLKVQA